MTRTTAIDSSRYNNYYDQSQKAKAESDSGSPAVKQVALDYLKTSSGVKNMIFKLTTSAFDIAGLYDPANASYKHMAAFSKDAKNFSEAAAVPDKSYQLTNQFSEFREQRSLESFGGLVRKVSEFFVPFCDVLKSASNHYLALGARSLVAVSFVGAISTVVGMSFGMDEEWSKIQKSVEDSNAVQWEPAELQVEKAAVAQTQVHNSLITIARNVHYWALGSFSAASTITGILAPAPLMVGLAAGGVLCTIGGHFHEKLYLEDAKNKLAEKEKEIQI